jgi:hypothetical protein
MQKDLDNPTGTEPSSPATERRRCTSAAFAPKLERVFELFPVLRDRKGAGRGLAERR